MYSIGERSLMLVLSYSAMLPGWIYDFRCARDDVEIGFSIEDCNNMETPK